MNDIPSFLIIGATGGIGRELTAQLASTGANLTLCCRSEAVLQELATETGSKSVSVDAREYSQLEGAVKQHLDWYGALDGIANCAGSILLKPAHLTSEAEFAAVVGTNLTTAFNTVKAAARPMMAARRGSIVLVSSAAAERGLTNHEAIAAAKGGVVGLTRSAAATYANRQVRVNCVSPGLVATPATTRITQSETSLEQSQAMHALGRIGQPEDVASAIAWLLDESRSGWVTGQVLGVDGGLGSLMPRPR
jgi:NAD(P)-dependent dehydrogenase (short-subunit alcohol dehydrogenase family)